MKPENFSHLANLLKERSGLTVTMDKIYLFEARLMPIARLLNIASLDQLIAVMRQNRDETLIGSVVDAMTTNETSFFRDRHPFEAMKVAILPGLIQRRAARRHLRVWSAACSSGQEAYSLAMMLLDDFPTLSGWRIEIVGTDISPTIVARAKDGAYSTFEVQRGLPIQTLVRHFDQDGPQWRVKPRLRQMVDFRLFNLLGDLAPLGQFDIILCRNVLIYFDLPTKARVLEGMRRRMADDGSLILGGAESVFGICDRFTDIAGLRGVYAAAASRATTPGIAGVRTTPPTRALT